MSSVAVRLMDKHESPSSFKFLAGCADVYVWGCVLSIPPVKTFSYKLCVLCAFIMMVQQVSGVGYCD